MSVDGPRFDWEERFWSKVDKNGPVPGFNPDLGQCWIWTDKPAKVGYGRLNIHGKAEYAYRLSFILAYGEIPENKLPDHLCRVKMCVRPTHLEAVTWKENFLRGFHKTAISVRTNKCYRGHEFTPENTRLRPNRPGKRECVRCIRKRARDRWRRIHGK